MRVLFSKILVLVMLILALSGGVVFAQNKQIVLPSAGLTPNSPFYFFDRLGETLQEFFTFNKEKKAKLQIEFASERVSEIKTMIEEHKMSGINRAKTLLIGNVTRAAEIVNEVKSSGKKIKLLAKQIDNQFDNQEKILVDIFQKARKEISQKRINAQEFLLQKAKKTGNNNQIIQIQSKIDILKNESKILKKEKDNIKNKLTIEKKNIEKEMDAQEQLKDKKEQAIVDKEEQKKDNEIEKEQKEPIEKPEQKEKTENIEKKEIKESENNSENIEGLQSNQNEKGDREKSNERNTGEQDD